MKSQKEFCKKYFNYFLVFLFLIFAINFIIAEPNFINPSESLSNQSLTEDILFITYINATGTETGENTSLYYDITSESSSLFKPTTVEGDPDYGLITFTPTQANVGEYVVIFVVNSSWGADAATVNFTIIQVNDAPVIDVTNQSINEDENPDDDWIDLWTYASDEETATSSLTFAIQSQSNASLIDCSLVSNQYVNCTNPAANQSGYTDIIVNVTDGNSWDSSTFNITVIPVNDPPIFNSSVLISNMAWPEDTINDSMNITPSFYDIDSDDINYTYTSVSNLTVSVNNDTGQVTFTPDGNFSGIRYIRFRGDDGVDLGDYSNNITLNVTEVNDAPVLNLKTNFLEVIDIESYYNFSENVTDVEGDTLYFYTNNSIFPINETTGIINTSFTGESPAIHWINVSVNDSNGAITSKIINLTLINNTAPTFDTLPGTLNATEDEEFYYNVTSNVSDFEGNLIYFYDNFSLFDINETTGIINFTGNNSQVGSYWINFTINDTYGYQSSQIVNFTINNTNDAPLLVGTIPNLTWAEDTAATYNIYHLDRDCDEVENCLCDPDEDSVTITHTSVSDITISINQATGLVTFTPDSDWYGTRTVIFNVTDGINTTQSNNITLNVTEVVEQIVTITTGGGGGGTSTKKLSVNIHPEKELKIYPNSKKAVNFVIENTGDTGFPDLTLEAYSDVESMIIDLNQSTFGIPAGQKSKVETIITTGSIEPGAHNITFLAKSNSQKFEQRVSIYFDITGDEMTRIQFVKDMFQENPECLELNELITRAENLLSLGKESEATALIEKAIEGCRDLVSSEDLSAGELSIWQNKKLIRYGGISFAVLILVSISIGYFIREFKSSKKPPREEWKFEVS